MSEYHFLNEKGGTGTGFGKPFRGVIVSRGEIAVGDTVAGVVYGDNGPVSTIYTSRVVGFREIGEAVVLIETMNSAYIVMVPSE